MLIRQQINDFLEGECLSLISNKYVASVHMNETEMRCAVLDVPFEVSKLRIEFDTLTQGLESFIGS
jgi:hypothetical protein